MVTETLNRSEALTRQSARLPSDADSSRQQHIRDRVPMKILLVGNDEFAGSVSMTIFAQALQKELALLGIDVKLIMPRPFLWRVLRSPNGVGKWLGYFDRFLLFPRQLRKAAATADVIHVCDHSDAMYASMVKSKPVLVTCHDMLAVRGSRGELPGWRVSLVGPLLQRWVCRGMKDASQIACVSQYTLDETISILGKESRSCLVLNGLNHPFHQLSESEIENRLIDLPATREPYILHIGSNHARKNREGVLRIFARASKTTSLNLVIAGSALSDSLIEQAKQLGIFYRIVQIPDADVSIVEALYNRAVALVFPSRFEGFGWPPIEAQACGCPVVGSDIAPLVEVLGDSAVLKALDDERGLADAICRLTTDNEYRRSLQLRGFANVHSRFQTSQMVDSYISLYKTLMNNA